MYNILVVDDESLMRSYLSSSIPTFTKSFQVSGIAKDGLEAMELLKQQHYDLVITDIKMPEVDGLSLARYISENIPDTIVIIISGYSDFEYARKAIKYHVTDYLLKPLNDQNLTDLLESIAIKLDQKVKSNFLSSSTPCSDEMLKKQLLSSILDENLNSTYELYKQTEKKDISLMLRKGCIVKFTIDDLSLMLLKNNALDVTSYHLKLNRICQIICANYSYSNLYNKNGDTLVLVSAETIDLMKTAVHELYNKINETALKDNLPKIITICGNTVSDILDLNLSLNSIQNILPLTLMKPVYPLFHTTANEEITFINSITKICDSIFTNYLTQATDHLYADIKKYCEFFYNDINLSTVLRYGSYLIKYINDRSNINPSIIRNAYTILTDLVDTYHEMGIQDLSTATLIISNAINALMTHSSKSPISESMQLVNTAKEFILSHYNESISLSNVADYIGINSSYLSDLFHKTLNEPYSKYLLRIRMEQAAKLIRQNPNIRIYNVAEQTGFVSVKHFTTVFKKYYGVTPTNFV